MSNLLKPKQIAAQLEISYAAVLDLFHSGELPNVSIPGRVEEEDRRRTKPIVMKPRRSFRADQADVDALIVKWKTGASVGLKVDLIESKSSSKSQQNARPAKKAKTAGGALKPLWYKEFA